MGIVPYTTINNSFAFFKSIWYFKWYIPIGTSLNVTDNYVKVIELMVPCIFTISLYNIIKPVFPFKVVPTIINSNG